MAVDTSTWIPPDYEQWFQRVSESEWQAYLDYAEDLAYPYKEQKILRTMVTKARGYRAPSWKQIRWAMKIIENIEEERLTHSQS